MADTTTPPRSPLLFAASAVTVALAIYSGLELIVPFLLGWAIWGLMQRSKRADRRWISAAFAAPAAFLIWKLLDATVLQRHSFGLSETAMLGVPLLWLFFRPGKPALVFQVAVQAVIMVIFGRFLASFQPLAWGSAGFAMVLADLYFYVATIVFSSLALRRGVEVAAVSEAVG
jgi:hypothetical protein